MFPLIAAAAGVGALGAVGKFLGGLDQAAELRRQTRETVRRQSQQAATTVSEATALGAASGVEMGSTSLQMYLTQMSDEFKRQIEWTRRTGAKQASNAQSAATFGLFTDLAGTAFSAASMAGMGGKLPAGTGGAPSLPAGGFKLSSMFSGE